jgi:hypothetical protein
MCENDYRTRLEVRKMMTTLGGGRIMQAVKEQDVVGTEVEARRWVDFWIGLGVLTTVFAGMVWVVRILL